MNAHESPRRQPPARRWLVPEVIQTSAMDCGPAALKCLLEGHGIPASYGRLREACQTAVDGTSIEMVEQVARQLGLDAEQVMLPLDYVWLAAANAVPCMIVVQQPSGMTHFVIVWRRVGRWLQIMDPGVGRRWTTCQRFAREVMSHRLKVAAADWHEWAASDESLAMLTDRLCSLGATHAQATALLSETRRSGTWQALARLDAAARMLASLIGTRAMARGRTALGLLQSLLRRAEQSPDATGVIPAAYWPVLPSETEADQLILSGAVLLRVRGCLSAEAAREVEHVASAELTAALREPPTRPLHELWTLLRTDGLLAPLALLGALGLAVGALVIEALLFRGMFELADDLSQLGQRAAALGALLVFAVLLWALELPILRESLRLGRRLETRLRLSLLQKLPLLNDRYFSSRPISDVAERSHSLYLTRHLPDLGLRLLRGGWDVLFTLLGIAWVDPASLPPAALIAVFCIVLPLVSQSALSERDLRVRSHGGALYGFYLDALLGIAPIRTHMAERSVRREHESLLVEWARASRAFLRLSVMVRAVQSLACMVLAGWLLYRHVAAQGVSGNLLLLAYWVLKLPAVAESLAVLATQYPTQRNIVLRLFEPLKAPEDAALRAPPAPGLRKRGPQLIKPAAPVAIELQGVDVVAAGHFILREVQLSIRAGEHLAIVGPSGAGKSSLLGLLLGWHQAVRGTVLIDQEVLSGERLVQLRSETAWVDPAIQLWNRSLLENLRYSSSVGPYAGLGQILESADLTNMLVRLPDGLQSLLAEGGARLSGGEGQRVRLARALWQQGVRLALLDEPFRGLDREQRRRRLAEARRHWQDTTLVCITHDVAETRSFERVLVVDGGQIIEDGHPAELEAQPASRYRRLLEIENSLRHGLWNATLWRHVRLEAGQTQEASSARTEDTPHHAQRGRP